MPPKKKPQSSTSSSTSSTSSSKQLCCVCCQPIAVGKDESLFCGGDCQQSLYRYCAGVSLNGYKEMKGNGDPFCCFSCSEKRNKRDIATLKSTLEARDLRAQKILDTSAVSVYERTQGLWHVFSTKLRLCHC